MIAKRNRDRNGRLKTSYFFDKDGKIKGGGNLFDLDRAIRESLPHHVLLDEIDFENGMDDDLTQWFRENVSGAWNIWVEGNGSLKKLFLFENAADALHFKMRWS